MLLRLLTVAVATSVAAAQSAWPHAPFKTSGRDIIKWREGRLCGDELAWFFPEELQYQCVAAIVSKIKSLGMNVIRLTYAIEMIDDILSNNPDSSLSGTLTRALGPENATVILQQILQHNPSFTASTTRLEVFDAVAAECHKQHILVHLDNHVSRGVWCCGTGDSNAWFGSADFNVANWRRGNAYMATHAQSWPAYVSQSLRNELRDPGNAALNYGRAAWYENMIPTADAVHAANPTPLIFYSGLNFDLDLRNVTRGLPLTADGTAFDLASFSYADKIVFELHNYNNNLEDAVCADFSMYDQGYNAMDTSSATTAKNIAPVVLTEFGFPQDGTTYTRPYADCIKAYLTGLPGGPGGWIQWAVGGSYYIRQGIQDYEETWALLNHDWSHWRSQTTVDNYFAPFVRATLG